MDSERQSTTPPVDALHQNEEEEEEETSDDEAEGGDCDDDAGLVMVINPFWARTPQDPLLTVKTPTPAVMPLSTELLMASSDWSVPPPPPPPPPRRSSHYNASVRRPLVKQKKQFYHSVDDLQQPTPATPPSHHSKVQVEPSDEPLLSYSISASGYSSPPPPPCCPPEATTTTTVDNGVRRSALGPCRAASSRQQSVESRVSYCNNPPVIVHPRPSSSNTTNFGRCGSSATTAAAAAVISNEAIEDGAPLPAAFEPVPLNLYGKPLREIDHTVKDKTFVVVSKRFRKNYIHRFSATRSCFLFSPWNPLRRIAIYLSTHPYFDYVVMTTILLNCIFLAMTEPVEQAEYVFLGIYSCEMVIKAVAKGLVLDRLTYLRNPWNWLDFVVILSGYATLAVEIGNLAGLRTFRVLRALKTVSIIPGLRTIINALLKAMRQLLEVMTLIVFCLSVLALFALQVFMGELRNKCVQRWNANVTSNDWHEWIRQEKHWLEDETGSIRLCGNLSGSWHCPANYSCLPGLGDNPNFGYTNFDTFPWSMLTTFQLITLDYWENIYNMVLAVCGPYTIVFFMIVVFFGAFYLINLMLAVVAMSYDDEAHVNSQSEKEKNSTKTLTDYREESTFSFDPGKLQLDSGKLELVLLEKGYQQSQAQLSKARKKMLQANRNQGDDLHETSRPPQVAQIVWALTKTDVVKLSTNPPPPLLPPPVQVIIEPQDDDDNQDPGFTLEVMEPPSVADVGDNKDEPSMIMTIDNQQKTTSGSSNFANSFNTDVGYSSETSRAPSYPSSVVFKRRNYTSKQSVSQNFSSLTESIGSQERESDTEIHIVGGGGPPSSLLDIHRRSSPPGGGHHHNTESRRLSYKKACDPDKRISMALIESSTAATASSVTSASSSSVATLQKPAPAPLAPPPPIITNHNGGGAGDNNTIGYYISDQPPPLTDDQWLKRRQSYHRASRRQSPFDQLPTRRHRRHHIFSLHCLLTVVACVRKVLDRVVQSPWMDFFITISIVLNTAFLAAEHHGMSPDVKHVLDVGNKVFTAVFTTECVLKLGALGFDFFRNGWNVFDFVIVLASLVDLGLEIVNGLSVLRGMRLMRVLRLAQSWTTMRVLLSIILSSLGALANLTFVLAIVVYIFAVIGMQLFGRDYTEENFYPDPVPRWNFKDFFHSFMMIFRILCGEWAEPLWDCMRAERNSGSEICFSIFLPALVMGNFLVLNLFLALLLNSFSCEELKSRKEEINEDSKLVEGLKKIRTIAKATRTLVNLNSFERTDSVANNNKTAVHPLPPIGEQPQSAPEAQPLPLQRSIIVPGRCQSCSALYQQQQQQQQVIGRRVMRSCSSLELAGRQEDDPAEGEEGPVLVDWSFLIPTVLDVIPNLPDASNKKKVVKIEGEGDDSTPSVVLSGQEEMPDEPPDCLPASMSCYKCADCLQRSSPQMSKLFQKWVAFRSLLLKIVKHPAFEWSILILIFGSSITLCFEDIYLEENPRLMSILHWTNTTFAVLFALEMVIKWFALGIRYYFSSVWTALDFVIVMVSLVSVAVEDSANLSALRSLRTLRALRPLRAISRWQGMKIVVNALMFAIPAIFNVLLVCLVFWLVFSILGVQLFGGKFYKCVNDETGDRFPPQVVDTKADCLSRNLTWKNSPIHFDHVGHAYLALFQVATFEGWMEIMADAVDVRGVDLQPAYEENLWAYLYFVVFIVCGAFFTLNLFIGVIIDNFNMLKKKYEGGVLEMFLTESQKHYYTAMKKLGRKKPRKMIRRPMNPYLALFYDIAMSRRFEIAIFIMIFLNMVVMGVEHYGQPPVFTFILELCNALFTTMFALEAVVKMIGLRHHYFTLPWNLFDLTLVSASVVGLIMEDVLNEFPISPTLLRVVRVFRLGRVLRLVKAAKGIRKLLFALIVSLPALFNIGALLALITFIYAIIGMALFGHVTHSGALNEMVNFETFGRSMLLLFRLMTGAGWNDILNPLLIQPPYCDLTYRNLPYGNCGSPLLATLYLVSFIVLSSMIVINMYIAVLLENFNQAHHEEELGLGEEDLERFYAKWSRFDPYATQFIAFNELSDFVASLDPPLGISRPNTAALVNLDILIASGDRLHCLDILHALTKRVLGDVEDTEHFRKLQEQMDEKFKKQFPNRRELEIVSSTGKWKQRDTSARVIQKAYRSFKRRKFEEKQRMNSLRGHVQTQTSFSTLSGSTSSFEYEPDKVSLRSVLNRMSSLFHTYLGGGGGGGLSRQGSAHRSNNKTVEDSPSPSAVSVASGTSSRHSSISRKRRSSGAAARSSSSQRNSALLDVLSPGGGGGGGSRRSSIWSLGTLVVSAQVHNEGNNNEESPSTSSDAVGNRRGSTCSNNGQQPLLRSDVIVKLTAASEDSDMNI